MKKLNYLIFVLTFLISCKAGYYTSASTQANQSFIGMSIVDFKKQAGKRAILEEMGNGRTIYKMHDYDAMTASIIDTKFFYFDSNGKLFKIDGGVMQQQRIQVEKINR